MLDSNQSTQFLNPDNYLNHLSPAEGFRFQVKEALTMVLFGAALWDMLAYLTIDLRIVRGNPFAFNIFCFIFSRLFTLGHIIIISNIFPAAKISSRSLYIISGSFYMLAMITSSFLFLQRVLAVHHENKLVRRGFFIFWLVASLSDIIIPIGGHPHEIPGMKKRKDAGIDPWIIICIWIGFSFDTAVIGAISYKMWLSHRLPDENLPWYQRVFGKTLPPLARLIFTGGLQYYSIVAWAVMMTGIAQGLPSVPQIYKAMFPAITLFLIASMSSRVFRNVKLFGSDNLFPVSAPAT